MKKLRAYAGFLLIIAVIYGCNSNKHTDDKQTSENISGGKTKVWDTVYNLPPPSDDEKKFSKVIGWKEGQTPKAPAGFKITKFVDGLQNPRWTYQLPNGDILVAEAKTESGFFKKIGEDIIGKSDSESEADNANIITLLRDADKDGKSEVREIFLIGLNQPFGMLLLNNFFYVANTDGLWRYPYTEGQTKITDKGQKILDLPAGGYNNHWTRNIIANADGSKIYISVGSGSNVGENGMENEIRRANILEINPDGTGERIYAAGLRNPVGMDWAPGTNVLWTAVNERDGLGDNLVPDYITGVKEGAFYGWPYAYFGQNEDPRMKGQNPELVKKTIAPDVALGSHTASLGLAFYKGNKFPERYRGGAFIGQHGSWNSSKLVGYKVVFVPFSNGRPSGSPEDFLTGFISNLEEGEVHGRPVGVTMLQDGAMLVSDDASNTIWHVQYQQ